MTAIAEQIDYLDFLISVIDTGGVIPVVGPDLVTIEQDGAQVPIDRFLARRLAERLRVPAAQLPDPTSLSDVVALHVQRGGASALVPFELQRLLKDTPLATPEPLRKLARIGRLRLFVSLTFDGLLARAINEVRFGGAARVEERAYSPKKRPEDVDLGAGWERGTLPLVFHLFGRVSAQKEYVITEEDTLEWLHVLQSESQRPPRLFDQLRESNLLFVGCRFPDWLARFMIRTTKGKQLSERREVMEFVADASAASDPSLTLFLDHFSASTKVFPGGAVEFVDQLVQRWELEHGAAEPAAPDGATLAAPGGAPLGAGASGMRPGSVFISYASDDREAAERLCAGLSESADVWLDREQLEAGADWDARIRQNIKECAVFVPLISRRASAQEARYFRREWMLAVNRLPEFFGLDRAFIVPVAIDDVPNGAPGVPGEFWSRQVERLPGGEVTDRFCRDISQIVRQFHERRVTGR